MDFLPREETVPDNLKVYKILRQEMEASTHGAFFKPREFDTSSDPHDLLSLSTAHATALPFNFNTFNNLAGKIDTLFATPESRHKMVHSLQEMLLNPTISRQLNSGGNIALVTNHISYIDLPLLMHGLAEAKLRLNGGRDAEIENHHVIISRLIGLFQMAGLGKNNSMGHIVDDGLLHFGGIFQTIPVSKIGDKIPVELSRRANIAFYDAYQEQLAKGGQIVVLAASGTQDTVKEDGRIHMATVQKPTSRLLSTPNNPRLGGKRGSLLTVPLFIDCQPFDNSGRIKEPSPISFAYGSSRLVTSLDDAHKVMRESAKLGNEHKQTSTAEIIYDEPITKRLGTSAMHDQA